MEFSIMKKIKELQDEAESKKKEIDDKKSEFEKQKEEFDKKKKELEELEQKGAAEIADAKKDINSKIEQLVVEEKKRFDLEEQQHIRAIKTEEQLEDILEEASTKNPAPRQVQYGDALQNIMSQNPTFYDLTNYNVTNRLESLASQANSRPLSKDEKDFIEIVAYHANNLAKDDYYKDKQGANYLARQLSQIDMINRMARKEQEKDYNV